MQLLHTYVAEMEQQMSLSDLPEALLLETLRHLDAPGLARLCVQDRRLRHVAGDQSLWRAVSLLRWPNCSHDAYDGDWQQLYRHRATLPTAFCNAVDRLHSLTSKAAAGQQQQLNTNSSPTNTPQRVNVYGFSQLPYARISGMIFDQIMMTLMDICLLANKDRRQQLGSSSSSKMNNMAGSSSSSSSDAGKSIIHQSAAAAAAALTIEMNEVKRDMAWWLNNKSEAFMSFGRSIVLLLDSDFDMWGSGYNNWTDVLIKRSALQFLMDLHLDQITYAICPSVTDRLQRECDRIDAALRSVDHEAAASLITRSPQGLPDSHWWYKMRGNGNTAMC